MKAIPHHYIRHLGFFLMHGRRGPLIIVVFFYEWIKRSSSVSLPFLFLDDVLIYYLQKYLLNRPFKYIYFKVFFTIVFIFTASVFSQPYACNIYLRQTSLWIQAWPEAVPGWDHTDSCLFVPSGSGVSAYELSCRLRTSRMELFAVADAGHNLSTTRNDDDWW